MLFIKARSQRSRGLSWIGRKAKAAPVRAIMKAIGSVSRDGRGSL